MRQADARLRHFVMRSLIMACAPGPAVLGQRALPVARPESTHVEPARSVLRALVGTWRFEVWFAGNFDGDPDASGTRLVTTLFDELRLQWIEELDHSPIQARGIIGFDPQRGQFISSTVSSVGFGAELMTGTLDSAEPLVTFRPIADSGDQAFTLTLLDVDHFGSAALDHSWRAVFTRRP